MTTKPASPEVQKTPDGNIDPKSKIAKLSAMKESIVPFAESSKHPILNSDESRFCVFPINHPDLWSMYKTAVASFWTVEEVTFKSDKDEFDALNANERHFLKTILAFFAQSDGIVMENLSVNFANEVNSAEARNFYAFQEAIEAIHNEMYSLLIETFISDSVEKKEIFNALENFPTIRKKADWALKWLSNNGSHFAQRLAAFSMVEGVFFSGSFAAIFWIKQRNILHALTFSNELISRDEGLHTDFACLLFQKICPKPTPEEKEIVIQMMKEAVDIESHFFSDALPVSLIGMNVKLMVQYIKFVADRLLVELIGTKYYQVENPFTFMENISLEGKTNFFEKKVGEYQKMNVKSGGTSEFQLDADF